MVGNFTYTKETSELAHLKVHILNNVVKVTLKYTVHFWRKKWDEYRNASKTKLVQKLIKVNNTIFN